MLPACGYELLCPLFDGAIVRPIAPDACIGGVKIAISRSYGVEIRPREISARREMDFPPDAAAATLPDREAGVLPETKSAAERPAAAVGAARSSDAGPATITMRDSFATEPGEAALARDASSGPKDVAVAARRNANGPDQGNDVDTVTTYKGAG